MKVVILFGYFIVLVATIDTSSEYLGCFVDQIGDRDLTTFIGEYEQLTVQQCLVRCREQNFPYAAIQYGNECRCGRQYGRYGPAGDNECDHLCMNSEKCGGDRRNSVYRVTYSSDENQTAEVCRNDLAGYRGCFDMNSLMIRMDSVNSLGKCVERCAEKYNYAGVIDGHMCYCGVELNASLLDSSSCHTGCSESLNITMRDCCGGPNALSVYDIQSYQSSVVHDSPETIVRVKRADAVNFSVQTSYASSLSPVQTSSAGYAPTLSSSYSQITSSPSTSISPLVTFTTSRTNYVPDTVYTSLMISAVMSTTPVSSTKVLETLYTTSHTYTSTAFTIVASDTIATSTTPIGTAPSSTSYITTPTNSFATASIPSATIISSSPNTMPSSTPSHINTQTSTNPISSVSVEPSTSSRQSAGSSLISTLIALTMTSGATTYNNPSSFSATTTRESSTTVPITSPNSSQITTTVSGQNSSERSIVTNLVSSTNALANSSASIGAQTTMSVSFRPDTTTPTITITTTTTTVTTTTIALSYVISTVLVVAPNQTFTPTDISTRESLRAKLIQIMNFAFRCATNASATNCTQTRQRIKRQICSSGYDVNLVSNISQIPDTTATKYQTNYTVLDLCNGSRLVEPVQVKTATDRLTRAQITNILQYDYEGEFVRSTSIVTPDNPVADRKLWIIGAVLGPVAFTLLLLFLFCYLHYKCRPRQANRLLTKPKNNPPLSARSTTNPGVSNEPVTQSAPVEKTGLHALTQHDPIVGAGPSFRRLTSSESEESSKHRIAQQSASTNIPMDEIRHQNDVERWRNKLRLQEQYHPITSTDRLDVLPASTDRSNPYQSDNRVYLHDQSSVSTSTDNGLLPSRSTRPPPKSPEIEAGRTKLHRLLDEVLDKADTEELYNPDSEVERQKRRRQRRRVHSISSDPQALPPIISTPQIPHIPVVAQVSERPDPSILRPHYNPYEAGDRTYDLSRAKPVQLIPKYDLDDERHPQYSSRSNPPLFYDDTNIADRAATATDAFAVPKRMAKTRLETDREAAMRHDGGQIDRRPHRFNDDAVYIDSISKNRGQVRTAWAEPEPENSPYRQNDYRDEYIMAKRSVLNTKNIISSIHDELQHIVLPKSEDYHA